MNWIVVGAVCGALGVSLGAFGAHGLEPLLSKGDRVETYEIAVRYQMYHAAALVLVGLLAGRLASPWLTAAGWAFLSGIVIFCGSLYLLAVLDASGYSWARMLGAITPLGGLAMIVGWCALAVAGWQGGRS